MKTTKKFMAALVVLVLAIAAFALTLKPEKVQAAPPGCTGYAFVNPYAFSWVNGPPTFTFNGRTLTQTEIDNGFQVFNGQTVTVTGCAFVGCGPIVSFSAVRNSTPPVGSNTDYGYYEAGMSSRTFQFGIICASGSNPPQPPAAIVDEFDPTYCN